VISTNRPGGGTIKEMDQRRAPGRPLDEGDGSDERALVEGCRAGNAAALERFVRLHTPRVERTVGRMVGRTPDLEDLVQTTLVEAVRSFGRFRGEARLSTWVTRIAVHVVQHHLRRGVRRMAPLEVLTAEHEPMDLSPSPERLVADRHVAERLHRLLDRVAPKKRVAFLLYTVEGYSIEEVAALTGAGRAATKSRIWFARRELVALVHDDPVLRALVEGGR
jgi:RNA polymerase sigma-70 factor (ECF subfamily)